ncbi:hypothetical protein SCA6_017014 [Theobroma cacao]
MPITHSCPPLDEIRSWSFFHVARSLWCQKDKATIQNFSTLLWSSCCNVTRFSIQRPPFLPNEAQHFVTIRILHWSKTLSRE